MKHSIQILKALGQANEAQLEMPESPEREAFEAALAHAVQTANRLAATEGVSVDQRYDAFTEPRA